MICFILFLVRIDRGLHMFLAGSVASCIKDSLKDPEFSRQATDYRPGALLPSVCKERCAHDNMKYAALSGGSLCLCGLTSGRYGKAEEEECNLACSGSIHEKCGGHYANTVYDMPKSVMALSINIPASVRALELQVISVQMASGEVLSYEYEFDDGSPKILASEPSISHIFHLSKVHTITVHATDLSKKRVTAVTTSNVVFAMRGLELDCPPASTLWESFTCNVTLIEGSGVEVKVDVTDGTVLYFYPHDTSVASYGDVILGSPPEEVSSDVLTLLLVVTVSGHLSAVDVYTTKTGTVSLMVYRPNCPPSYSFCHHSYSCIPVTSECNSVNSIWKTNCQGSDRIYSLSKRKCLYTATGSEVPEDSIFKKMKKNPSNTWNLEKKSKLEIVAHKAGFNQMKVIDEVFVKKGDILVLEDPANIVRQNKANSEEIGLSDQDILEAPLDLKKLTLKNVRHLIRSHISRPSHIEFTHNFTRGLLSYKITAQARSNLTNSSDTKSFIMDVQSPILDIDFGGNIIATRNSTINLWIKPHTGNNVSYSWDFGDGDTLENITYKNTSHFYGPPGIYNLILVAENDVSRKEKQASVIIQDPVVNLTLKTEMDALVFGQDALIEWSVLQGTDVIYTIETEDKVFNMSEDYIEDNIQANITGFNAKLVYQYKTVGNYSFVLNASNLVSWEEKTIYLPVQKIIKNFRVADHKTVAWGDPVSLTLLMDEGSHLQMNASFNEIDITNITMSDETGVGHAFIQPEQNTEIGTLVFAITYSNLVTAPSTYTKEVKVQFSLTNVSVLADEMFVVPETLVTFNLTMTRGSDYKVNWYYDYPAQQSSQHDKTVTGDVVQFSHQYTTVKNYTVIFSLSNDISDVTLNLIIIVQNPVTDFTLQVVTPLHLYQSSPGQDKVSPVQSTATLTFNPSSDQVPAPTDAFYYLSFDDGPQSTFWEYMNESQSVYTNSYTFTKVGTYYVKANVSNLASVQHLVKIIDADQPIVGAKISASHRYANVSQAVTVYLTLTWGSRVNVTLKWGDKKSDYIHIENFYDATNVTHIYKAPKTYVIEATLYNSVSKFTLTTKITVQNPVDISPMDVLCHQGPSVSKVEPGLHAGNNWRVGFFCKFHVKKRPYPSSARYNITYDDGNPELNIVLNKLPKQWTKGKYYTEGGDYVVKIDIFNRVSHMHYEFHEKVIEALDKLVLSVTALKNGTIGTVQPRSVKYNFDENGREVSNYFSMEDTLNITVLQGHGSHVTYTWDMGDGLKANKSSSPEWFYKYNKPGHYLVKVGAENNATVKIEPLSITLHIQNEIRNIAISCPTPKPRNETFIFDINFGSFGYESCYAIDFVETTPSYAEPEVSFQLYGNKSQCKKLWSKSHSNWEELYIHNAIAEEDHSRVPKPSGNMTVEFTFWLPAVNLVKLYAENVVSKQEYTWRMVVTRGVCYDPVMDLKEVNSCFDVNTLCNTTIPSENVPQHYRSRILGVRSNVKPNCTSTQSMLYTWTVHRVNVNTWANMEKLDEKELKDTVLTSRELRIRYRILSYGVYRFTLNVSMEGEIGIEKIDSVVYQIVKTPLRGNILGGREARYQWQTNITIDASSQTYDPDVDEEDRLGNPGMVFYWFCKRQCEKWPTFSDDSRRVQEVPDGTNDTACGQYEEEWDSGCIYNDGIKTPHAEFTNTSIGVVRFNSTYMFENATYEVRVVVWKDVRTITLTQYITIIPGDPPSAKLICVTNCEPKYNKNDRFSVKLIVEGKTSLSYSYKWEFYRVRTLGAALARTLLTGWEQYVTTGVDKENLALDPGYFLQDSNLDFTDLYYFLLKVWRTSGPEDNYGTAAHSFTINEGPKMEDFQVGPEKGIACETEFKVTANPCVGRELMVPISYDAFYKIENDWTLFWNSNSPKTIRLILPKGREPDFAVDIRVKCTDRIGSYSQKQKQVYTSIPKDVVLVTDPNADDAAAIEAKNIENLLSSDPARAPECSIELALPPMPVAPITTTSSTTITTTTKRVPGGIEEEVPDVTTMDPTYLWTEEFEAKQMKRMENEKLGEARKLLAVTFSTVVPTDLSQANIIAASVSVIMENPEQNFFETMSAAVTTTDNIITLIDESITSQEASAGQIDEASRSCICLSSRIIETLTRMARDCRELLNEDISSLNLETAILDEVIAKQEECNRTIVQIEDMLNTTKTRMTSLGDKLMKIKVNSESATIVSCGEVKMNADKQFAENLNNKELKTEDVKVRFPTNAKEFFGGENSTAYAYEIQTLVMKVNPYSYANDSFKVSTPVMSFNLKNESQGEVEVDNSTEDLAIKLPRSPDMEEPEKAVLSADNEISYFTVDVEPNSALIIRVTPFVNETTNETTAEPPVVTAEDRPPCIDEADGDKEGVTLTSVTKCSTTSQSTDHTPNPTTPLVPLIQENVTKEWEVYIKEAERPNINSRDYEFNCSLPLDVADVKELLEKSGVSAEEDDAPDMYTCFVAAEALNRTYSARFFVAIKKLKTTHDEEPSSRRRKRSADGEDAEQEAEEPVTPSGSLELRTSRCVWWDQEETKWSPEGCRPGPMTKGSVQQCLCKRTGTFAADFIVPPNLPDFSQFAFSRLNEEPLVFSVMLGLLCFYFVCLIWARKADKIDDIMAGAAPLSDNSLDDKYLYELIVYTGSRSRSGTTARVYFTLMGDKGETKPRFLHDSARPTLKRNSVDRFIMSVSRSLGQLAHIRIWHDNSGVDPSWFFSRMQVTDLQTQEKVFFMSDRWLAVEEDDGAIERIVPIAGTGELVNFQHLFYVKTRRNLSDSHLWFSVLQRPVRSRFTRVQRLTCCLVLIFTAMMASIMFYNVIDPNAQVLISLGPVKITLGQLFVGIVSSLIAIPPSMLVITLFRYSRPKPPPEQKYNTDLSMNQENTHKSSASINPSPVGASDIDVTVVKETEMNKSTNAGKSKKKKKKFSLPYWCVHVGYVVSFIVVLVTLYMTVGIAIEFGKTKAREWLIAFVLSFFESVLFSQPLKVFVLAMIYALLIKKPDTEEEEEDDELRAPLGENEEWLHKHPAENGEERIEMPGKIKPPKRVIQPLDNNLIEAARKKKMEELQMRNVLWDVTTYLIFLILLMVVAYSNKSPHAFQLYQSFRNAMLKGAYGNKTYSLQKVINRELMWEFVQQTLVPTLYNESWYNNVSYRNSRGLFADKQSVMMGEPRLRLLRTKPEPCPPEIQWFEAVCRPAYSMFNQDETSYKQGWLHVNISDLGEKPDEMWRFSSHTDLKGYPYWGDHATYSGGGYVAGLGTNNQTAQRVITELVHKGWIDRMTRAVFVEYLIYNDNVKLFGACMSVIEFTQSGGVHPTFKFYVIRLNPYIGARKYVSIVTELLLLCFILYFFFIQVKNIYKQRLAYFKKLANCFELSVVVLCVAMVVYFFYRLFVSMEMEKEIKKHPDKYHNFDYLVLLYETYNYLLAFITALSTIKLIKLLRFNKRMSMLGSTLLYALPPLLNFWFMFVFVFMAFTMFSHLMFGSKLLNFSTVIRSMETLFSAMLNRFDYRSMHTANKVFGPFILFSFTTVVGLMLMNVLVTVILEAFTAVKYDLTKQTNEHEMIDFIIQRVAGMIGRREKIKQREYHGTESSEKINTLCDEGGPTEDLSVRVDQLLDIVEKLIVIKPGEKHTFQEEIFKLEESKKTRVIYMSA